MQSPENRNPTQAKEALDGAEKRRVLDERFTDLYKNIRGLAARVRWNGTNPTLNPTALAHEAYLKLRSSAPDLSTKSYEEVIAIFANAMLQILRDAARRKNAGKRKFQEVAGPPNVPVDEALIVAEALDALYCQNPLQARVAQCRYLFGMTVGETAAALGLPSRKVERLWQEAKIQLTTTLKSAGATP